ncbi:MAG: hypothetical protein G01um101438_186 [Parcubacteria group bacterium Gr01-1014_38]|nr:MAG: hypothetical protein G01um101438_186 [Parcubacteria group bacterium Gr01-1014_38]
MSWLSASAGPVTMPNRAFLIPTRRFAPTGTLAFAEADALSTDGTIPDTDMPRVIEALTKEVVEGKFSMA